MWLRSRYAVFVLIQLLFLMRDFSFAESNIESRAVPVLIARFETVLRTPSELLLSSDAYNGQRRPDLEVLRFPFVQLVEALDSQGKNISKGVLRNSKAVVVGAREFRSPAGLGPVRSHRCYVAILRNRGASDLHQYFQSVSKTTAEGATLWSWSAAVGEFGELDKRPSSFHATLIGNSYLVVCNNLEDFQVIFKQLSSGDAHTSNEIGGWENIRQYEYWGYRHYRHGSPDKTAAGLSVVSPGTRALVFFVDFRKKIATLRVLSSPQDENASAMINAKAILPPLKRSSAGLWETTIPLRGNEQSSERLVAILHWYGFGIYI